LLRDLTELRYVTLKGGVSKFVKLAREVAQQLYLIRLLNGHGKLLAGLIQSETPPANQAHVRVHLDQVALEIGIRIG